MAAYDKGDVVRITAAFKELDSTLVDPSQVKFSWVVSGSAATTYTYGAVDEKIKRASLGVYYIDFYIPQGGRYGYQWTADGIVSAVAEGGFVARDDVPYSN